MSATPTQLRCWCDEPSALATSVFECDDLRNQFPIITKSMIDEKIKLSFDVANRINYTSCLYFPKNFNKLKEINHKKLFWHVMTRQASLAFRGVVGGVDWRI